MKIEYVERKTKRRCIEKIYGQRALFLLYGDGYLNRLFSKATLSLLSRFPFFSQFYGFLQKRPGSRKKIARFIRKFGLDETEFSETNFRSFNDFFIRKLKPERRPVVADPHRLAMPADGRYLVYPEFNRFFVKGKRFSAATFLQDEPLAHRFADGSMMIVRLCPTDYHRFHFPCDGVASQPRLINGFLYSVNPIALRKRMSVLTENKRVVTEIETKQFGSILYVEIGATSVGSIHQTFDSAKPIQKGQEKGYFEFGGSCIVLLFEKGRIAFDPDLVAHTQEGLETLALFGDSLGSSQK